jgi:hypothetical protein
VWVPVSTAEGVYVTEHADTPAVVAANVHVAVDVNVPGLFVENVIVPVGLPGATGPVTVAVALTALPTCVVVGESATVVVVLSSALSVTSAESYLTL